MISFSQIMRQVLTERMSFRDLLSNTDSGRKSRATHVKSKSLGVRTMDDNEAWTFSYKSQGNHSTTGQRHHGFIRFFKENISANDDVEDLDCMVDCSCEDYRYRFAYRNAKNGAGTTGNNSLNKNNGRTPLPVNDNSGICKHLVSLGRFLKTSINAPNPEDETPSLAPVKEPQKVSPMRPSQCPSTTKAPEPGDSYSDSRGGDSYSDGRELQEGVSGLYDKFQQFVKNNPEFEVPYE